ncbi:hypothetical protein C1645_828810 [Glomus cerebriforme]|uniref:F-box domain-containing protein n=1 Tax=Glomus cerebriforme TaxID=658196 RepID=A0A397SVI3_9GLOM|nr:hypothetical protein C1645_828810 [Glomus cerebriforme]
MSKINSDVLYLIFEEVRDDKETLHSCLLVNKTWCELIIPILWRNPWKYLEMENEKFLLNVIISHLSDESKNNLKSQCTANILKNPYQKRPLFNYISFCRHLNLNGIQRITNFLHEKSDISIIQNEIFNLFINSKNKFTHLYIPRQFNYQIHLIPEAKHCFSEIEFLSFYTNINDNILDGLIEICKSIKELVLLIGYYYNNYRIVNLIEIQEKLLNVRFLTYYDNYLAHDKSFCKILEGSLIKHANTIQYFKTVKPLTTKILSSFVNLKVLELDGNYFDPLNCLKNLSNLSLPLLQNLKAKFVSIEVLINLIENTSGYLDEINIDYTFYDEISNKKIIQTIYQNCPNLKYLKLLLMNCNILELEKLLINCQYLDGLHISNTRDDIFNWDNLFEILTKSSPISLFKFKFNNYHTTPKLDSLKLFFDNWKGRHPMLLQFYRIGIYNDVIHLIRKYEFINISKYDCNDFY